MKYFHAFLGAIYGTVISYPILLILIPIMVLIAFVKEGIIPVIRKNPLKIPLIILAIAILAMPIVGLSLLSPIALGLSIGKNTAIACYNHGWRGWSAPFKFIQLIISEQYQDENIKNINGFSQDEKYKRAEAAISSQAIKTNNVIKKNIGIPIEISALITVYSIEDYKKHYDNGDILIEKQDAATMAEKKLNKYINQSHIDSWSARFFSCFRLCRHLPCNNNVSASSRFTDAP